jgi:50S ribosomal protein L16 3-hydroxylase
VGLRSPSQAELARELLLRLADEVVEAEGFDALYCDATQPATRAPGAVPAALQRFAQQALARALRDPAALARALGEVLSEPKPQVWFNEGKALHAGAGLRLDARTRMLYDRRHIFINGESYRAAGGDASALRRLADRRALAAHDVARLSADAQGVLQQWAAAGWVRMADI